MKFTLAVFAALIIGSNAGILGNLANLAISNPITNAVIVTNQANALVANFTSQINNAASAAGQNINQQTQTVASNIQTILKGALAAVQSADAQVQLTAAEAAEVATEVASALATLASKTADTIDQVNAAIIALPIKIAAAVGPSIVTLNNKILSGFLKPTCFTNEVPAINAKIATVVNNTKTGLQAAIDQTFQTVASDVSSLQTIANDLQVAIQTGSFSLSLFKAILTAAFKIPTDIQGLVPNFEAAVGAVVVNTAAQLVVIGAEVVTCSA